MSVLLHDSEYWLTNEENTCSKKYVGLLTNAKNYMDETCKQWISCFKENRNRKHTCTLSWKSTLDLKEFKEYFRFERVEIPETHNEGLKNLTLEGQRTKKEATINLYLMSFCKNRCQNIDKKIYSLVCLFNSLSTSYGSFNSFSWLLC